MKVLGVEFKEYACFDKQWVPLRPGVSIIAGKNNAGKTALIRGLCCLAQLPIIQSFSPKADFRGYCRIGRGLPAYLDLDIYVSLDESDDPEAFATGGAQGWYEFVRTNSPLVRHSFRFVAESSYCQYLRSDVVFGDNSRSLITTNGQKNNELLLFRYDYPNAAVTDSRPFARATSSGQFGPQHIFGENIAYFEGLAYLKSIVYIDSHRVADSTMALQTVNDLFPRANNLAGFLQTLQGRDPRKFGAIQTFISSAFPEFEYINPESESDKVALKLTLRGTDTKIPLTHCGTGVEQLLALGTFVLTASPSTILLDEPHVFLHPQAERVLAKFLNEHTEHRFVVSTHSAIMMNSVDPTHITYVQSPGQGFSSAESFKQAKVLFDLGYKNSDVLFYDYLTCVEGRSDKAIIPILLHASGVIPEDKLSNTGFVVLDGVGDVQNSVLRQEHMILSLRRAPIKRMYLLDGDKRPEQRETLQRTRVAEEEPVSVEFLPVAEIENLLMVPSAVADAINEEQAISPSDRVATAEDVAALFDEHAHPKGSVVLERVYDVYGKRYSKERSGRLIAQRLTVGLQPLLNDLARLFDNMYRDW